MKKILLMLIISFSLHSVTSHANPPTVAVHINVLKSCWYQAGNTQIFQFLVDNNSHNVFGNNIYIWLNIGGTIYGPMSPYNVYYDNLTGGWYYEYDALANGLNLPTPLPNCINFTYHYVSDYVEPYQWETICKCDNTACDATFQLFVFNTSNGIGVVPNGCNPGYTYNVDFGDGTIWSMAHPNCVGFSYNYANPGTYTICVTATNGVETCQKCKDICINDFEDIEDGDGAAPEQGNPNSSKLVQPSVGFGIYPVPAQDQIKVDFQSLNKENINIEVLNIEGASVKKLNYNASVGKNIVDVDIKNLQPGMYMIKLSGKNQTTTKRFSITQ
ncbi:MAG TPA: T9SS type A sorting domain-containing protein [Flavipsychrobacter sp.]|nr:T9SS type A sorting domain-containing protein [Flavipsychrobacter sp.]